MFLLSQNDENQSENGSKNSKICLRARPPAEPQKKMLQTKKLRSKSWKTRGFFHFSLADFGRARSRTGVFRTVFYSVFWRRASRPIKNRRFWPKNAPPPPGKPVTFLRVPSGRSCPSTFGAGGFILLIVATMIELCMLTYIRIHNYIYIYICMYIDIFTYMYVHTYTCDTCV